MVNRANDEELLLGIVEELERRGAMELVLQPVTVFHLCGILQLALRHPKLGDPSRQVAQQFLTGARAYFAECPTVLEVLRRGDNPQEDR